MQVLDLPDGFSCLSIGSTYLPLGALGSSIMMALSLEQASLMRREYFTLRRFSLTSLRSRALPSLRTLITSSLALFSRVGLMPQVIRNMSQSIMLTSLCRSISSAAAFLNLHLAGSMKLLFPKTHFFCSPSAGCVTSCRSASLWSIACCSFSKVVLSIMHFFAITALVEASWA